MLERGDFRAFGFLIDYAPSQIALTDSDKTLLKGIASTNAFIEYVASRAFVSAPSSMTEADVTVARGHIE